MPRNKGDSPSDREHRRAAARKTRKPAVPGTFTGHEAGVGATAQAIKRNKRSV